MPHILTLYFQTFGKQLDAYDFISIVFGNVFAIRSHGDFEGDFLGEGCNHGCADAAGASFYPDGCGWWDGWCRFVIYEKVPGLLFYRFIVK